MKTNLNIWYSLLLVLMLSCSMEKELDIPLPEFQSQLVVEAYLEPGKPYKLLLTQTTSYFDSIQTPFINRAKVSIAKDGITYQLSNNLKVDSLFRKIYNYTSLDTVPLDFNGSYTLNIEDPIGRKVVASTKLLPIVEIDTIEWRFKSDSTAYLITWLYDDASVKNYYRLIINKKNMHNNSEMRFQFNDERLNGQRIPLGTGYRFNVGDTVFVRLFHLDKQYYDYLESTENASNSNGNPFSQPAMIKSNISGGLGIFTGLSVDTKTVIIK